MAATKLEDHPTVRAFRAGRMGPPGATSPRVLTGSELRQLCLAAGADDVGFVEIARPEIADQREEIEGLLPRARALISFVRRMNRDDIRTPARSIANVEFHHTGDEVNEIARRIVSRLEERGIRAVIGSPVGFPMEMDRWPAKAWILSHKSIAVAAGLGRMGIHRNVIHPRFGNFILLGTVVLDAEIDAYSRPIDYNPCLECKLCVAVCPTGAISPDGHFNFSACYTHNYREFMGGFADWVETVADSRTARDYRARVSDSETVSMWQSLGFGPNYKAAYCMAVCPAGEEVIAPFLGERKRFLDEVVKPLQDKSEIVYVVPNSDAEDHVARRFPNKRTKRVGNGIRPATIDGFLRGLPIAFQPERSRGLDATYHFTFTGAEARKATVIIRDRRVQVADGHVGSADFRLTADSGTWLRFLRHEANLAVALLRAKFRFKGSPRLLLAFGCCFPS
jgi:ferredoxin